MIENGEVVRASDGSVDVRLVPSDACESCGACSAFGPDAMVMRDVADRTGARVGDVVEVEMPEGTRLRASLIGYGVPLLVLAGGYLAGVLLAGVVGTDPDLTGAVTAVISVALVLVWLRARGGSVMSHERFRPWVRAIIRRSAVP